MMALRLDISGPPEPSGRSWSAPAPEPAPALDWRLLLYNLALMLATPVLAGYLAWRLVVQRKSRGGWGERMGFVRPQARHRPGGPRIWLHGVSVGEVTVAARLLEAIKHRLPGAQVVLSTSTPAGRVMAERSCPQADAIFYFPLDYMPTVERTLRLVRPDLLLLMEGELWPNLLSAARRRGVATMVVNGRISDRTLRRSRLLRPVLRWVVRRVDRFCMQSERDVERIVRLGVAPARASNLGNVKFDQMIPRVPPAARAELARLLGIAGAQTVIVAGSTHPGEEKIALDAFHTVRQIDPAARLIIAPRHIERAAEVEYAVAQAGLRSRRRSRGTPAAAEGPNTVVILDTIGELQRVYSLATVAFVGGSFVTVGGHNVLEAMAQGVPCVVGPHTHNFRDITGIMTQAKLGFQVERPEDLGPAVAWLLEDRRRVEAIGRRCEEVLAEHRGAVGRYAQAAAEMLSYRPPGVQGDSWAQLRGFVVEALSGANRSAAARLLVALFAPLSAVYWIGLKLDRLAYRLGLAKPAHLPARVVSVGNLTAGGTGKTSAAALLAAAALKQGKRPAILSRGYGRRGGNHRSAVVSDGSQMLADHVSAGDEPYLLARKVAGAAVLVGADRRDTGRQAVEELGADTLILDDGFQYWRLAKDREIVLIDALTPFGTGLLLPAGILREPLDHLCRAHSLWLTHSDLAGKARVEAIRARVRRFFDGPIVETIHRPLALRSLDGGETLDLSELQGELVAALSGIGNPLAFELTLQRLGARVLPLRFPDHHPYSPADCLAIQRFARRRGAVIITTEKDAVRLPPAAFSTPVWVLEIELAALNPSVDLAAAAETEIR